MKIIKYTVVRAGHISEFIFTVSDLIAKGWSPFGSLVILPDSILVREMVIYEDAKPIDLILKSNLEKQEQIALAPIERFRKLANERVKSLYKQMDEAKEPSKRIIFHNVVPELSGDFVIFELKYVDYLPENSLFCSRCQWH